MARSISFADVLEAVEQLSAEDQEAIVEIVRCRESERGRKRVATDARDAQREFMDGHCRPATASEFMDEVLS